MAKITLSRREQEVAALVAAGLTNREIAERLVIAERTAEYHVEQIRNKLGFRSRVHIAAWFIERSNFPPRTPGNVPVQLTSFVGRESEITQVKHLLAENRMVTLVGPPGSGKTRLALQVASQIATRFRDGCWLIELAPIRDGAQLGAALAAALKVPEHPGEDLLETVASALRARRVLVLLDNCEHVIDAAAHAAESLLRSSPEISVLVTTREPLRSKGEIAYRIPPFAEAETLFCDRAAQVSPNFKSTPMVAAICAHLDGLPLAIELAAARVAVMSTDELAAGLDRSLRLLASGTRTAERRQQSLSAAIEWSHDLLSPDERLVFARLSVFEGEFRLEAAEVVCGEGLRDVGELALGLADKSLLSPAVRAGQSTRYRLLETLRQYATESLVEAESEPTRRRHFEFYLKWAEAHGPTLGRTDQVGVDQVAEEIANIRAALVWSRTREPEGHLRLARSASMFWLTRGSTVEARSWLEPALSASADRGKTRADVLWAVAIIAGRQGDPEASRRYNREAVDIYRRLEDWSQLARVLNNVAFVSQDQGEVEALLTEALECARRSQDKAVIALVLESRGETLERQGQMAAARAAHEESLALRRVDGHHWGSVRSLIALAYLALDEGDRIAAGIYLAEALDISRGIGDSYGLALVLEAFARRSAEPSRVLRLAASARAMRERTGDRSPGARGLEERLRSSRNQLGAEAPAIEAAGYLMSLDEAVAEALAEP